jgi:carboxymethylenebutenolidase
MGTTVELTADDGHRLDAYEASAEGNAKGGLVVVQEIFGVNDHIRAVCDGFVAEGYNVVSPALFDRVERGVELAYGEDTFMRGRALRAEIGWDQVVLDVKAAAERLKSPGAVGVVGYCWGGSAAWLAACRLDLACAVGYYGGHIIEFNDERPRCPTMLHFGERDSFIPMADVEQIRTAHPDVPVHVYPADHGFNCDARASHDPESAGTARQRTLAFFTLHVGAA